MGESSKKDNSIVVAIIGAIGIIVAAVISKIDFTNEPRKENETVLQENRDTAKHQNELKLKSDKNTAKYSNIREEKSKTTDSNYTNNLSSIRICFKDQKSKVELSNYQVSFEGYQFISTTDIGGCIFMPSTIIEKEESISSYLIRVVLKKGNKTSSPINVSTLESSTYKIKFTQ